MSRKAWTTVDDAELWRIWNADEPLTVSAARFEGRTTHSLRARAALLGLGPRKASSHYWTAEEDATLRQIWAEQGSLKSKLSRLPGRTWRAALVRAKTLGLSARTAKQRAVRYSWVEAEIDRQLPDGRALTVGQIADNTPASYERIGQVLANGHGTKYRIADWVRTRSTGTGSFWPKWAIGTEPDAPYPEIKSAAQSAREYRKRQRIREGRIDPFATLAQQVTA